MSFALRVATLNLRHDADRWRERLPLAVAELARELPHLVGLQEVSIPVDQGGLLVGQLNRVCREAGQDASYDIRLQPKMGPEGLREGIAVLSRLPVEDHSWLDLAGGSRVAQRVRVRLPGGQAVDLYNTHLHHERQAHELRRDQALRLLAWIDQESTQAFPILVGDMNALPGSPAIGALKRRFHSAYELVHGDEPEATFDYVLVPGEAGERVHVVGARLAFATPADWDPSLYPSDHYGLVADIAFEEGARG
jgi:endonuclease/exonuclease/phosphatase family metal-dependent hydrolase